MNRWLDITAEAHADIERNAVWWAEHHSIKQAIEWKATVYDQVRAIPLMPASHPLAPENPQFRDEIRQQSVGLGAGGYRAVFAIREDKLLVLTIERDSQRPLDPADFE